MTNERVEVILQKETKPKKNFVVIFYGKDWREFVPVLAESADNAEHMAYGMMEDLFGKEKVLSITKIIIEERDCEEDDFDF